MGDAIFRGREQWGGYDHVIVMWGDQVGVSEATLRRVAEELRAATRPTLVLPLVATPQPYVEYLLDGAGRLTRVLQSREGDACAPGGRADVGVFGLGVPGLVEAWAGYERLGVRGARTGEANFLPFLPYLSTTMGWPVVPVAVHDPEEARGINTPEDLAYFRDRFAKDARGERA
jgi:bifunctional UDP-N-acetylglucosamine pyrophosphorylase/glucosamine-1-phosphate N-acetyltransferase